MSITTRKAVEEDLDHLVSLGAAVQGSRSTHAGLFPSEETEIRAAIVSGDLLRHAWVAQSGGDIVAWVTGDHVEAAVRWMGPFSHEEGWEEQASAVLEAARANCDATQEVIHADNRNYHLTALASQLGFIGSTGIVEIDLSVPLKDSIVMVHPMRDEFRGFVSMFHEATFPDGDVVGSAIVNATDPDLTMVIRHFGEAVGYINATRESDKTARINFLAVSEEVRRKRLGGEMVRAAVNALVEQGVSVTRVEVDDENEPARELFRSLGFTEQRLVIPFTK
jgi:ribosomal protein S18 acetylase RimI-like enzyme